jgi:hypothetical protein
MFARLLTATALALSPALALAATDCPWTGELAVSATMRTVTVNGETWLVQGVLGRHQFYDALVSCGASEAALQFTHWRDARVFTNATAVGGVVVDDRAFLGTLAAAVLAGKHKRQMVEALETMVIEPPAEAPESALADNW